MASLVFRIVIDCPVVSCIAFLGSSLQLLLINHRSECLPNFAFASVYFEFVNNLHRNLTGKVLWNYDRYVCLSNKQYLFGFCIQI